MPQPGGQTRRTVTSRTRAPLNRTVPETVAAPKKLEAAKKRVPENLALPKSATSANAAGP